MHYHQNTVTTIVSLDNNESNFGRLTTTLLTLKVLFYHRTYTCGLFELIPINLIRDNGAKEESRLMVIAKLLQRLLYHFLKGWESNDVLCRQLL